MSVVVFEPGASGGADLAGRRDREARLARALIVEVELVAARVVHRATASTEVT